MANNGFPALIGSATSYALLCTGRADGGYCPFAGQYLAWYDPNKESITDLGGFTKDVNKAMRFASVGEALEVWKRVREVDPIRPDGKLNRPLTAFSMEVRRIIDA